MNTKIVSYKDKKNQVQDFLEIKDEDMHYPLRMGRKKCLIILKYIEDIRAFATSKSSLQVEITKRESSRGMTG